MPIARHTFDTSNVERLAQGLSERLNINIKYGINAYPYQLTRLAFPACDFDGFYELGRLTRHEGEPHWMLWRECGGELELYEQLGEAMADLPIFEEVPEVFDGQFNLRQAKNFLANPMYLLEHEDDEDCYMWIYRECADIDLFYCYRYWYFFESVTMKDDGYRWHPESLLSYRTAMMAVALLLGSDRIYYLNDQAGPVHVFDDVTRRSWPDILAYVKDAAGANLWVIADVLNTKEECEKGIVLMDDFSDLDKERARRFLPDLRGLDGKTDWEGV
jgi:hypothetical protein